MDLYFFIFRLFNSFDSTNVQYKFCLRLDSNRRPVELEATALPTEPQPLPNCHRTQMVSMQMNPSKACWFQLIQVGEGLAKTIRFALPESSNIERCVCAKNNSSLQVFPAVGIGKRIMAEGYLTSSEHFCQVISERKRTTFGVMLSYLQQSWSTASLTEHQS